MHASATAQRVRVEPATSRSRARRSNTGHRVTQVVVAGLHDNPYLSVITCLMKLNVRS